MATNTYVALDKITLSNTASSVTFSSINQGYTDLFVVVNATSTTGGYDLGMQVNGDTGTNYSTTYLYGTGSAAGSARISNSARMYATYYGGVSTARSNQIIQFMNYSNSTTYKTVLSRANRADSGTDATVSLWRSTAAITSITLNPQTGGTFAVGSTFSLYGIKAWAPEVTPKATGGYVYSDSTYWYHAFPFSSTFTPNQSLTADILVVAGGGGSGEMGGGGGAGGLLLHSSQSLTATNYTCTVGSGGTNAVGVNASSASGTNSQFASLTASVGGGGGGIYSTNSAGKNGGSGGGATRGAGGQTGGTATSGQGFAGGTHPGGTTVNAGAGGGGAGAAGSNVTTSAGGNGGNGSSTYSSWILATGVGEIVSGVGYIAGGGGGGTDIAGATTLGGYGGGGIGIYTTDTSRKNGQVATGGGGGGARDTTGAATAGNGGSGVIIVRYAK